MGFLLTASIEILQPFFDRSFDVNDIILNTIGTFISATLFFVIKKLRDKNEHRHEERKGIS